MLSLRNADAMSAVWKPIRRLNGRTLPFNCKNLMIVLHLDDEIIWCSRACALSSASSLNNDRIRGGETLFSAPRDSPDTCWHVLSLTGADNHERIQEFQRTMAMVRGVCSAFAASASLPSCRLRWAGFCKLRDLGSSIGHRTRRARLLLALPVV